MSEIKFYLLTYLLYLLCWIFSLLVAVRISFKPSMPAREQQGRVTALRWEQFLHRNFTNATNHAKIFYFIVLLVFCKFSYRTYRNGLNQVPQSWDLLGPSKNSNRVSSIPFVGNLHFSMFVHRVRDLKNLFVSRR